MTLPLHHEQSEGRRRFTGIGGADSQSDLPGNNGLRGSVSNPSLGNAESENLENKVLEKHLLKKASRIEKVM